MLTKMYLTNFLSFPQRTEFDFTASKYNILSQTNLTGFGVLKGALFVGANASGKSNVLKGIALLIELIKGEGTHLENYHCHFSKNSSTEIEYEFLIDGKTINYKIQHDIRKKEIRENLTVDNLCVLYRDGSHGELHLENLSTAENELDSETLFLRTASFNTGRFPQDIVLRHFMDFLLNSEYIDGYNQSARTGKSIRKYAEDNGVEKVNKCLKDFRYDFQIEYGNESEGEGLKIVISSDRKSIFFKRNNFPVPSEFLDESQGNQVFLDMLPRLIDITEKPGILIVDEFGNSLHNRLAEKIISYFMKNSERSQLFISSHDTNLISNSVLRPDQIQIVSFEDKYGSRVRRVSDFKPREAQNLEKMYLGGMFEGIPDYDTEI